MIYSKIIRILSKVICITAIILGVFALCWNVIYDSHSWHNYIFRETRYTEDIIGRFALCILCFLVFGIAFILIKKKSENKIIKISAYILFALYNIAALIIIALVIGDSLTYKRDYNDMKLDNQLISENSDKFHEAIDSIISRSTNRRVYDLSEPNDYMMLAARCGYSPAQNYMGVYFHEHAKKINDGKYAYRNWNNSMTDYCQEELNRATYWWLKAAEQNHKDAQENLGLLWMKEILGTQMYSYGDAKFWLTEAANNGKSSAYYYLGLLCRDYSLSEAAKYFKEGAERGDENCLRMLENPVFIDIQILNHNKD